MKTFVCDIDCKLFDFLLNAYNQTLSFNAFNKLLKNKDIKINGVRVSKNVAVYENDIIDVYYDTYIPPFVFDIIYQDQNLIITNKPKGITSEQYFKNLATVYPNIFFVHRLDRNTDGLMVFALSENIYDELLKAFKDRTIDKFYTATVYGKITKPTLLCDYLIKDSKNNLVKVFNRKLPGSKPIKTAVSPIEIFADHTIIKVELLTGRTHQIRAHLSFIGHPILGDDKYGEPNINKKFGFNIQQLTSTELTFHFENQSPLFYLNNKNFKILKKPHENV